MQKKSVERLNNNASKFPTILNVDFSLLDVCSVAVDFSLFQSSYKISSASSVLLYLFILNISWGKQGLGSS